MLSGCIKKIYQGKSCSVYLVDEKDFQRGLTSWNPEFVSEKEVEVISEIVIDDMYQRLLEEEHNGKVQMFDMSSAMYTDRK